MTIRTRITALFGALLLVSGALMLLVTYLLVRANLPNESPAVTVVDAGRGKAILDGRTGKALDPAALNAVIQAKQRHLQSRTMHLLLTESGLTLAGMTLVALAVGYLVARHAMRPLTGVTTAIRRVVSRNLHEQIEVPQARDEIHELATTFNAMLIRLDHAFQSQRRFAANASHELKTPLAVNRTLMELTLEDPRAHAEARELAGRLLSMNIRHEQLVQGLLLLARSDRDRINRDDIDLAAIARTTLSQSGPAVTQAKLTVDAVLEKAEMRGDAVLIEHLMHNLFRNAIQYNHVNGWLQVRTRRSHDAVEFTVENTGRTVDPARVSALFEPFDRGSSAPRTDCAGSGLGLSIARSIVESHDGTITADARAGGGLSVVITLPAPVPSADGTAI